MTLHDVTRKNSIIINTIEKFKGWCQHLILVNLVMMVLSQLRADDLMNLLMIIIVPTFGGALGSTGLRGRPRPRFIGGSPPWEALWENIFWFFSFYQYDIK
jgi:hypothetical protein